MRDDPQGPVHHLFVMIEPELHRQVREAKAGCFIAVWLRHTLHQITRADFPAHWREDEGAVPTIDPAGRAGRRSHDSRADDRRMLIRLDAPSQTKLQQVAEYFQTPRAEIIRQLVAYAKPEEFPASWRMAAEERRQRHPAPEPGDARRARGSSGPRGVPRPLDTSTKTRRASSGG